MALRGTVEKARKLRRAMSLPEVKLWALLRARPDGVRFRRQHPIGPYVLDFYCPPARLAVEIDGASHGMGDRPDHDQARDAWLASEGVTTIRIPAADVLDCPEDVLTFIIGRAAFPLHHPADGPPPHASHGEDV